MKIEDKNLFVSEYNQMLKHNEYVQYIEKLKKDRDTRRLKVFLDYTRILRYTEWQLYNEKNAAVEVLNILLEVKSELEKFDLPWLKYLLEEIDDRVKGHQLMIENRIWGLSSWITMSVYTESDIVLRGAEALDNIITCYEREIENLKNSKTDDGALSETPNIDNEEKEVL